MRYLLIFVTCILKVGAEYEDLWSGFKKEYGKIYGPEEEEYRFRIFQDNLQQYEIHNDMYESGESTFYVGINEFSDQTLLEIQEMIQAPKKKAKTKYRPKVYRSTAPQDEPEEFDWREKDVVYDVVDQNYCGGASVAISVCGSVEGRYTITHGKKIKLSPQCLLDCSTLFGNITCDGFPDEHAGFEYIAYKGIPTEEDYPYLGRDSNDTCMMNEYIKSEVTIKGFFDIYPREEFLKRNLVKYGPISVLVNSPLMVQYKGGIFDGLYNGTMCSNESTDAYSGMLVVGYGTENATDYWILRNSWGTPWGEDGYMRLAQTGYNTTGICGILTNAMYPWLI